MPDSQDCLQRAAPPGVGARTRAVAHQPRPVSQAEHLTAAWSGEGPGSCWGSCNTVTSCNNVTVPSPKFPAGVLTFAWAAARATLTDLGYEVSVFHATGA